MNTSNYNIYDASAGSGKTFTLVKEYLKILLKSNNKNQFKYILAITFTNKAVAEMKERIIETLKQFSNHVIIEQPNSMFNLLSEELSMPPESLHEKSKLLLKQIIHNYAAFDVSTIDGFTHKIIRTFAHDLKLPLNFEVELDQNMLLAEAVDALISKAGSDTYLTKTLVDFAIEKADDDKSWDIALDLKNMAKLLINERDIPFIKELDDKTPEDFKSLKKQLKDEVIITETQIVEIAKKALTLIKECGLEFTDFLGGSRAYLPNYFLKLEQLNLKVDYTAAWVNNLNEKPLYPVSKTSDAVKEILDEIKPMIVSSFNETKASVFHIKFLKAIYKNITPLSVLSQINKELNTIKQDQNKVMISEFNTIISKQIKNQPTPFIYERLGEKFRHYFIDEFQDTSELQWQNLIPLIDNALSGQNIEGEQGTAMLVGDAKQAIYRWRGGKAEQFIDLFSDSTSPFQTKPTVENLPVNYRSYNEIVSFNNSFFKLLSEHVFGNDSYKNLYIEGSKQEPSIRHNGFVKMSFLDINKGDNRDELYPEKVLETISDCIDNGYSLSDICVLVRKKKEGIAIAELLSSHKIKIMSSETMLIANSPEVKFLNSILQLILQPNNNEVKVAALNFVADTYSIENKHDFFVTHLALSPIELFNSFKAFSVDLNHSELLQLPLYELAESIVRAFALVKTSNAYIQFYLDFILEYSHKKGTDLSGFLDHFESKKETLSIVSPKNQDAVQIMTIHKSKGLEFPVVIFPYADLDIYREMDPKEWFPLDKEKYNGFSNTLLNYGKDFENYGEAGLEIFNKHKSELELDNINLLYVALTRPIEQLHIIGKKDITAKGEINLKTYSGLLINYLNQSGMYLDSESVYTFGDSKREVTPIQTEINTIQHQEFISTAKESHDIKIVSKAGLLWDTAQQEAIEKGNLIHDIMARIKTESDIDFAIDDYFRTGIINLEQVAILKQKIKQIVDHPELRDYYSSAITSYNERDIISKNGTILRPDRLVINQNQEAIIIDYKTGLHNPKYVEQLQDYQDIIEEMNFKVIKKTLVYINDDLKIVDY